MPRVENCWVNGFSVELLRAVPPISTGIPRRKGKIQTPTGPFFVEVLTWYNLAARERERERRRRPQRHREHGEKRRATVEENPSRAKKQIH